MKLISQAFLAFLLALAVLVPADTALAVPPGGSFVDDDGNVHEGYIEAIRAEGITYGCNPPVNDHYCPDRNLTRGEMAALLVRALGLTYDGGKDWFSDDNGSLFESSINRLAAAGITKGCDSNSYCPGELVTRQQMAAFLVRAYNMNGSTEDNPFVDDNNSVFEDDIEVLSANGVTKGCNPPANTMFCPYQPVGRDAMASFIGRASSLTPLTPAPRVDVGDVDVHINPGDDINSIAGSHSEGTVFMIHGEYHGQQVSPRDYQVFIGDDAVMDGDNWAGSAFNSAATGVQIINIEIKNYESGDWSAAITSTGGDWLVESCNVHDNRTTGIWFDGGAPVVRNNNIHHNGRAGMTIWETDGALVENNTIAYNNPDGAWDWGNYAAGVKIWETDGTVLQGNWVHHNLAPGLWADGNNIDTTYANNTVEDNYANGIFHEISYDAVIRDNVIRRNGAGHDVWLWGGGIMIASSPNVEIYGNTLEDNANGIALTRQDRGSGLYGEHTLANIHVYNNSVTDSGMTGIAKDYGGDEVYYSGNTFENNTYSGSSSWFWLNREVSWSQWNSYGNDD
jgi:parallel beta-helix repeat protein